MGYARPRPKHLAAKLLQIRRTLNLTQKQLADSLGLPDHHVISKYEHDQNEPPLAVLLAYSRLAKIPVETLIDDDMDLFD